MNKLYFVETNVGFMTVATSDDGRACYMWQDGREQNYPTQNPAWNESVRTEREQIALAWLRSIADVNTFDGLYANSDVIESGYVGVYTVQEFREDLKKTGDRIIASIEF